MEIEVVVDVKEIAEGEVEEMTLDTENEIPSVRIYIVQAGDTLWQIAKRYNTTMDAIVKANDIKDPNMIMPGQKLIIP